MSMKRRIEKAVVEYATGLPQATIRAKSFVDGANFVLDNLWVADTDDESLLPPVGKNVIVAISYGSHYTISVACRISKELSAYSFGNAGWNIPNVRYFMNIEFPNL